MYCHYIGWCVEKCPLYRCPLFRVSFIRGSAVHTSSSTEGSLRFPTRVRVRQPGDEREVRMMLFLGFVAHWINRSRENPHSRSVTLANTA